MGDQNKQMTVVDKEFPVYQECLNVGKEVLEDVKVGPGGSKWCDGCNSWQYPGYFEGKYYWVTHIDWTKEKVI